MNNKSLNVFVGYGKNLDDDVPVKERLAASEHSIEGDKEILQINKELVDAFAQIRAAFKDELSTYIDSKNIDGYSDFRKKIKDRLTDAASLFPQSREGEKLKLEFKQKTLADVQQFLKVSGIEAKRVKGLQKKYISQLESTINRVLEIEDEKEMAQVHTDTSNLPGPTSNPWTWYNPPYAGHWSDWWWERTRGSSWANSSANRVTGEIDCWSGLSLGGADDNDYSWANSRSEVRFWFRMPAAGMLEVWGYFQAIQAEFSGCLSDEWGISNASIQQLSRPYLRIISPAGAAWRYGLLLDYRRGESEGCWSGKINGANPGDFRYPHLFSTLSYSAGQWVLAAIGVHDYNYLWVNDMSCSANLYSRWFVKNIAVRSTGAP